ncbi:angiotensin-converting enzyme [Anabrus simplex]|uniref:angiotensin-converting enzyme n=1 Tax=Anabrus simplex TaxID=316456 RepID=UPI0035A37DC8
MAVNVDNIQELQREYSVFPPRSRSTAARRRGMLLISLWIASWRMALHLPIMLLSAPEVCGIAVGDSGYAYQGPNTNLGEALNFLREYDREGSSMCFRVNSARWQYSTNTTEANRRRKLEQEALHAKFQRLSWRRATAFAWKQLPDPVARRQLKMLVTDGRSSLPDDKFNELQQLVSEMKDIYTRTEICPYGTRINLYCNMVIDPDITRAMAQSRDYEEQLYFWRSWHDAVGPPMRPKYVRYIQLVNEAAMRNGFHDAGEQMRAVYEDNQFEDQLNEVWASLAPLYRKLHAYVRKRLLEHYGSQKVRPDGPLPAHLLGNMWAQNWKNLAPMVLPFPRKLPIDVTTEMLRQGYTPLRMFQTAEEFFTSLGLKSMPPEFWHHSMLEKPLDREVTCSASAWDFCNQKDYRIKQCTSVTMEDLLALHHEMAHIQYYLQYADQPVVFRTGANPGFHEALGDTIALYAGNPRHLQRIGLLNNATDDQESTLNYLMSIALEKVAYLPFAYIVDQWRWQLFAGKWSVDEMNSHWWDLRLRHQGVIPPIPRSEQDFDPGAKYHIAADMPYVRYFVSLVLQFQMYESLCVAAGHYGPLHTCDIYRSRDAGRLIEEMLSLGSSRPWPDVVRVMTRGLTNRLDPRPLLEFFKPLEDWLIVENRDERLVGWSTTEQDTALFAPLSSSAGVKEMSVFLLPLLFIIVLMRNNHSENS